MIKILHEKMLHAICIDSEKNNSLNDDSKP